MDNSRDPPVSIPGFQLFVSPYHFRPDTRSRSLLPGSCMVISNVLTVHRPSACGDVENSCQLLNVTCCLVCCKYSYLAVACIYSSPSTSNAECMVELRNVFSDLLTLTKHIVIVGDFNIIYFRRRQVSQITPIFFLIFSLHSMLQLLLELPIVLPP